ncbi:hypothetical protein P280DRAFT_531790 [Massarina eburnea CBS 473.64]|uniref:Uncharacterized protein n=1 Tax=Massarina eburnea CBS 473.64 TaxID=1395130 RepID=A0A6A6SCS6_9PLEO|nr:hypothetical protein P280DRAFT_531790 [Massarina eburnea CBS 473.64]
MGQCNIFTPSVKCHGTVYMVDGKIHGIDESLCIATNGTWIGNNGTCIANSVKVVEDKIYGIIEDQCNILNGTWNGNDSACVSTAARFRVRSENTLLLQNADVHLAEMSARDNTAMDKIHLFVAMFLLVSAIVVMAGLRLQKMRHPVRVQASRDIKTDLFKDKAMLNDGFEEVLTNDFS